MDIFHPRDKKHPPNKMPQCMGIKTDGERCARGENGFVHLEVPHLHFCNQHWAVYNRRVEIRRPLTVVVADQHHHPGTCLKWSTNRWCGRVCQNGDIFCNHHIILNQRRQQQQEAVREETERRNLLYTHYFTHEPPMNWRQVIDDLFARRDTLNNEDIWIVARRYFRTPRLREPALNQTWQFHMYLEWVINGRPGQPPDLNIDPHVPIAPPAPPRGQDLRAIARDGQNVHTRAVSEQTNKGLEKLLDIANKERSTLRSPDWIAARWLLRSYGKWTLVSRIVEDMQGWYGTQTCKIYNDWLYRKTLDGLYILIQNTKDQEIRNELYRRLFEECYESVGMCCEGHISRLCNVLVGFDETFAPPVPFGEILQSKMAAIAGLEVDTEEKIRQATAFFNEFAVPEAERVAWLEAF